MNFTQETLGFRRTSFSLVLSLLKPAFALVTAPAVLPIDLRSRHNARLPIFSDSAASARCLSPVEFLARIHLTSELLRFL